MNSKRDMDGNLYVDCTECARGWNGDKTCDAGWDVSEPKGELSA